jgi:ParB family chromosome partitioning protein
MGYVGDSIFWVEVDRIKPNPFQPRKTFDEAALRSLAESIRSYGVLQPLTVTRREIEKPEEGIAVEYELIAGERRLRAAKIAGLREVPVVIRTSEDSDRMKLEIAIIENLQREDLNPVDRALAFKRLADEFGLKHAEIGKRVGKSREYVSNTLRILALPKEMQDALQGGQISEGHTRPLLMLMDRVAEQTTLFKDILMKKLTVRDSEQLARRIATDRARKGDLTPELLLLERELQEKLGTNVRIEKKDNGGKVLIDFYSVEDLAHIRDMISKIQNGGIIMAAPVQPTPGAVEASSEVSEQPAEVVPPPQDQSDHSTDSGQDDLYSISNFSV